MVTALHQAGVSSADPATVIRRSRSLSVDGILEVRPSPRPFTNTYPGSRKRLGRWFTEALLHDDGKTWVLSKMWGTSTEETEAS